MFWLLDVEFIPHDMKWIVRLAGFVGVAWGSLGALYALGVVLLAPMAVRIDSADFRNALIWMLGGLLFYLPFLYSYIINLILKKQRFRRAALMASVIGIVVLIYGVMLVELQIRGVLLFYVVPIIAWVITAIYLSVPQKNVELTLG